MNHDQVKERLRWFLLAELVAPEDADRLTDSTPLITSGLLDSLATLNLLGFVRKEFGVRLQTHEIDANTLDTLEDMARLVAAKAAG